MTINRKIRIVIFFDGKNNHYDINIGPKDNPVFVAHTAWLDELLKENPRLKKAGVDTGSIKKIIEVGEDNEEIDYMNP